MLHTVNDILSALDNDNISVLLRLDLSADFDTFDHQILLSRLNSAFGIQSTALQWFQSYMSWGVGIAQWLERRTRDRKVPGSSPGWSGWRIFFSGVNFLF